MTRVVVHAGLTKTGTSAVQQWLLANRDALAEQGVEYPDHPIDSNGVSSGNRETLLEHRDGDYHVNEARIAETLAAAEAAGREVLLLSSEFFLQRLPDLVTALPADTRYVAYVRDPLTHLESAYNQKVKRRGLTLPFDPDMAEPNVSIRRLASILDELPDTTDIVLRPYHADLFEGGDVLADLLVTAGIDRTGLTLPEPVRINPSYTFPALEFMRAANHYPLGSIAPRLDVALQLCTAGEGPFSLLSRRQYRALRKAATAQFDVLIRTHGHDSLAGLRDLLVDEPQRPRRRQPAAPKDLRPVADHVRDQAPDVFAELEQLVTQHPATSALYRGFPAFD